MNTPAIAHLLGAVQRSLGRALLAAALRRALWGSTALIVVVIALRLFGLALPFSGVLLALGAVWALNLAWAAARRPDAAACALWADRHLGGATAFTTLLETAGASPASANAQAARWVQQWAEQRAPESHRLLGKHQAPTNLLRPLLSAVVCSALAGVVLTLHPPATETSARPAPPLPTPAGTPESSASVAQAADSPALVSEIATALRAAQSPEATGRDGAGRAAADGPARAGGAQGPQPSQTQQTPQGATSSAGKQANSTPVASGNPAKSPPHAGTGQATGASGGHEAGDSRDLRADVGVSPLLRGPIPMQRSATQGRHASPDRQADMDRLAAYDTEPATQANAALRAAPAPAAATPPPAADTARLTPTESSYVQAWMKANGRHR